MEIERSHGNSVDMRKNLSGIVNYERNQNFQNNSGVFNQNLSHNFTDYNNGQHSPYNNHNNFQQNNQSPLYKTNNFFSNSTNIQNNPTQGNQQRNSVLLQQNINRPSSSAGIMNHSNPQTSIHQNQGFKAQQSMLF